MTRPSKRPLTAFLFSLLAMFAHADAREIQKKSPIPATAAEASFTKVPSSTDMVGALNGAFGAHAHARANHAHGSLFDAVFVPSAAAAAVSRAPHFRAPSTRVLVRFSNFGGLPDIADNDQGAAPYGMSLKFFLAGEQQTDLVMHSFNGFPSASTADFLDFVKALATSGAGAAHPTALERYAATHPAAKAFLDAAKPAPASFISQPYYGVNTFKFTNAAGATTYGRYRMVPQGEAAFFDAGKAAHSAADYLRVDLLHRLHSGPAVMLLQLQIAEPGDALEDPSVAWPENRRVVELGRLSITAPAIETAERDRTLVFFPDELPDGIEPKDPMLTARTRAYAESLERRQ